MKENNAAVTIKNVSKTFKIPLDKSSGIKQHLVNFFRRKKGYRELNALNNVSFEIKKGEFFGIVGRNGSGKSTLLKTIAGIYEPDQGLVQVDGTLTPFIELGVGFNPELSGRENVFLNGALLGFGKKEMEAMYDDIVDFAELHDFMEERLKNYSSGMQVRLAFSIAIRAKSDILLLDEVLAVGDEAFREKCNEYFASQKGKKTIILVTHDMDAVEKFCTRAAFMDRGELKRVGTSDDIALAYRDLFVTEKEEKIDKENKSSLKNVKKDLIKLSKIATVQQDKESNRLKAQEDFLIKLTLHSDKQYKKTVTGINIVDSQNNIMLAVNTEKLQPEVELVEGDTNISFKIENIYTDGDYTISVAVANKEKGGKLLLHQPHVFKFSIKGIERSKHSLTHPKVEVSIDHADKE